MTTPTCICIPVEENITKGVIGCPVHYPIPCAPCAALREENARLRKGISFESLTTELLEDNAELRKRVNEHGGDMQLAGDIRWSLENEITALKERIEKLEAVIRQGIEERGRWPDGERALDQKPEGGKE
jgi:hypothetical protein